MKVGTKSLLFGYHSVWLHPFIVAAAWVRLYGWTWDPRIWAAFLVHDLGYWGKPNMDGAEGKAHPFLGARVMHFLFDWGWAECELETKVRSSSWHYFCLFHSRTMCAAYFGELSKLGYADKLAFNMYPSWLVWLLGTLSGENKEYMVKDRAPGWKAWMEQARAANANTLEGAWK